MVMQTAADQGHVVIWLLLLFASAGVFHHAGIKIPFFAFFSHDSGIRCQEAPKNMLVAMGLSAFLCILIGCLPGPLYSILPYAVDYQPYTATHVLLQLQLLFFSALAFTFLKLQGIYPPELRSVNLDVDWLYRKLLPATVRKIVRVVEPIRDRIYRGSKILISSTISAVKRYHDPQGMWGRTWETGNSVLLTVLILGALLIFYY